MSKGVPSAYDLWLASSAGKVYTEGKDSSEVGFVADWTVDQLRVAKNVVAIMNKYGVIPSVIGLAIGVNESNLDEYAVNIADAPDYGGSIGIFQLNQDPRAHPNTAFVASNAWYDYGYPEIRTRWESAYRSFGGWRAFLQNPVSFLSYAAPQMQGSIEWSEELAATRLEQAYQLLEMM
jgi:hypothetical protein